jgi:hypothetical protein
MAAEAPSSTAGALFECKTTKALTWGVPGFSELDRNIDALWQVSTATFYVDTDAKKLRFPRSPENSFDYDFELAQNGGKGNDWVAVGIPLSASRDLYLRIRPFESVKDEYPRLIPFGREMPFLMVHPLHIWLTTGTCKGLAGSE